MAISSYVVHICLADLEEKRSFGVVFKGGREREAASGRMCVRAHAWSQQDESHRV